MIVRVTLGHISGGERESCRSCPIALALQEAGLHEAEVFRGRVDYFPRPTFERVAVALPEAASDFIRLYDEFGHGEPFDLHLSAECFMEARS